MAKPEKDEVLKNPDDHTNTGGSTGSPSSDAAAATPHAADPHGSAAGEDKSSSKKANDKTSTNTEDTKDNDEWSYEELLATAQNEMAEWKDKYMRLHAEWDTYRRRTADQREEEKARATEKLVESLLPAIDDFERTIDYAQNNGEKGLFEGVEAVHAKLLDILKRDGVQVIDPVGEEFDALECQAVATSEDTSVPDETVAEVYQKGYKMGNKVLRPAMVTVSTGGPKRPPKEEE